MDGHHEGEYLPARWYRSSALLCRQLSDWLEKSESLSMVIQVSPQHTMMMIINVFINAHINELSLQQTSGQRLLVWLPVSMAQSERPVAGERQLVESRPPAKLLASPRVAGRARSLTPVARSTG